MAARIMNFVTVFFLATLVGATAAAPTKVNKSGCYEYCYASCAGGNSNEPSCKRYCADGCEMGDLLIASMIEATTKEAIKSKAELEAILTPKVPQAKV